MYAAYFKNDSVKNIIKNIILFPHRKRIKNNNQKYEAFKNRIFKLSRSYGRMDELKDDGYETVIAGSDQIWNITIADGDDAYFLPWVKNAKKVAYAPSLGAKNILKCADNPEKYKKMIDDFDALSIRENNGRKWIKDLCGKDVPVLLDPTLLLEREDYEKIENKNINIKEI